MPSPKETVATTSDALGLSLSTSKVLAAPELGGEFKSRALSFRDRESVVELGKYSTNHGDNVYGYAGATPGQIGDVRVGGAVGAYGPSDFSTANILAGVLASIPIRNGEVRALLSPRFGASNPGFFMSYSKSF